MDDVSVRRWVDIRMTRQHILLRHNPVRFTVVLDETTLSRVVGSPELMTEQLDHLLRMVKRENIDLRILPVKAGYCGVGAFVVLRLVEPYPVVAYAQTPMGDVCVEGTDASTLETRYEQLWNRSLGARKSLDVIADARSALCPSK